MVRVNKLLEGRIPRGDQRISDVFETLKMLPKQAVGIFKAGQGRSDFLVILGAHQFADILQLPSSSLSLFQRFGQLDGRPKRVGNGHP